MTLSRTCSRVLLKPATRLRDRLGLVACGTNGVSAEGAHAAPRTSVGGGAGAAVGSGRAGTASSAAIRRSTPRAPSACRTAGPRSHPASSEPLQGRGVDLAAAPPPDPSKAAWSWSAPPAEVRGQLRGDLRLHLLQRPGEQVAGLEEEDDGGDSEQQRREAAADQGVAAAAGWRGRAPGRKRRGRRGWRLRPGLRGKVGHGLSTPAGVAFRTRPLSITGVPGPAANIPP